MNNQKILVCILLVAIMISSILSSAYSSDLSANSFAWSMTGFDSNRTSCTKSDCLGGSEMEELWSKDIGSVGYMNASPAIGRDGSVFVSSVKYMDNSIGKAYCLDPKTGDVLWSDKIVTGKGSIPGPAYYYDEDKDKGYVIFLSSPAVEDRSSRNYTDGRAVCYNAETGKKEWVVESDSYFLCASPLVYGGKVFFNDMDGSFYCYSISSGKKLWERSHTPSPGSMAMGDGKIFFVNKAGYLQAIDASNGKRKWTTSTDLTSSIASLASPSYSNGTVYVGSEKDYMYAFDADDGKKKWRTKIINGVNGAPAISNGKIYFSTGTFEDMLDIFGDHKFYCLDASNGKEIWSKSRLSPSICSPSISGDYLITASMMTFKIYDKNTGKELDSSVFNMCQSGIAIGQGSVVFTNMSDVVCLVTDGASKVLISPDSIEFGEVTPKDNPKHELTIVNGSEKNIFKLETDSDWIKLNRDTVRLGEEETGTVDVSIDFSKVPKSREYTEGTIDISWGEGDDESKEISVSVTPMLPLGDPAEIEVTPDDMLVEINDSFEITTIVTDEDGFMFPDPELAFESTDEEVCTVSDDGVVESVGTGTCEIIVKCEDVDDRISVTVVEHIDPIFTDEIDFGIIDIDNLEIKEIAFESKSVDPLLIQLSHDIPWLNLDVDSVRLLSKSSGIVEVSIIETELPLGRTLSADILVKWDFGESVIHVKAQTKGPSVSPNEMDFGELNLCDIKEDKIIMNNSASTWIDIEVSTSAEWLTVSKDSFTIKSKGSEEISVEVNTEGMRLGQTLEGKVMFDWRKGGHLEVPVRFTTPPDDIPPEISVGEISELINANEVELTITTNEPCLVTVGELEVIKIEVDEDGEVEEVDGTEEEEESKVEENTYTVVIPLDEAPSINEITIVAVDLADNETSVTVSLINIKELVVELQIGSDTMIVDGEERDIKPAPAPTIISGSTMVPVRAVSEAFGADVEWVASTKSVIITHGETKIILTINSSTAIVGDSIETVEPPPHIISGSTMLPFRFIAEALGAEVKWDGETKTITLSLKVNPS